MFKVPGFASQPSLTASLQVRGSRQSDALLCCIPCHLITYALVLMPTQTSMRLMTPSPEYFLCPFAGFQVGAKTALQERALLETTQGRACNPTD